MDRYWEGQSISEISRAVGRPPGSVFTILRDRGGYVPAVRTRRPQFLSGTEREEISRGLASQQSIRSIAQRLERGQDIHRFPKRGAWGSHACMLSANTRRVTGPLRSRRPLRVWSATYRLTSRIEETVSLRSSTVCGDGSMGSLVMSARAVSCVTRASRDDAEAGLGRGALIAVRDDFVSTTRSAWN